MYNEELSMIKQLLILYCRRVIPSGISIMTKDMPGVGPMRLRYPIMPIHDYGNVMHKEMQALADMTLKKHKYQGMYPDVRFDNGTVEEVRGLDIK